MAYGVAVPGTSFPTPLSLPLYLFPVFQVLAEVSLPWGHLSDVLTGQRPSYACP